MASHSKQKKAMRKNRDIKKQRRRHKNIVKDQRKESKIKGIVIVS